MQTLTLAQETELVRLAQAGDEAARATLIDCFKQMIAATARAFAARYRTLPRATEDTEHEGLVGFLEALQRFDPKRGLRLSTYVHYWIRRRIGEFLAAESTEQARSLDGPPFPGAGGDLDRPDETEGGDSNKPRSLYDTLESPVDEPDDQSSKVQVLNRMRQYVDRLPPQHRQVVDYYFGLGRYHLTLAEIGKLMDLSPQEVSTLLNQALASLKASMRSLDD